MINPAYFYKQLKEHNVNFFSGVPDSLLKNICAYITDNTNAENHIISANEGNAVALAAGHHMASGNIPLIYMQNSGIGNAVNPILSLSDPKVYSIPMLLLIGWRGEPGKKDEPQHITQGEVTLDLLKAMNIQYEVVSREEPDIPQQIANAVTWARNGNMPFALVVRKGTFKNYNIKQHIETPYLLSREEAISKIINQLNGDEIIVSTTGKTSRELFEIRAALKQPHFTDFLTVGSMGHASQIALGIALNKPHKKVICIDGDGALLMHMGGLAIIGTNAPKNLLHIVINNGAHESVGGQPTVGFNLDIPAIAKASGYHWADFADNKTELDSILSNISEVSGPALLEIKTKIGSRDDLGRPTITPTDNKVDFMKNLQK